MIKRLFLQFLSDLSPPGIVANDLDGAGRSSPPGKLFPFGCTEKTLFTDIDVMLLVSSVKEF